MFRTTAWSLVEEARDRGGRALDALVRRYWGPVRRFAERHGFAPADAEDIAQEVLAIVSRESFLRKADASKGRFRSLLLAVTRHTMEGHRREQGALKRGGDAQIVPLDREAPAASPEEREDFDRLWAGNLLRLALDRLRAGHPDYAAAIELHYFQELSYREIAQRLGRKDHDVKNFIFQGKKHLRDFVDELIRGYCSSHEEFREEVNRLGPFLPAE